MISGFELGEHKNIAIIGGGIGIFPLYEFAKQANEGATVNTYLGFRNKDLIILENEFSKVSTSLLMATDDGTYGKKGYAIDYLKEDLSTKKIDAIYACGPLPMLKQVKELAIQNDIFCQISLEERMSCAIGACLGCSVQLAGEEIKYARVCKDGPVFNAKSVII